MSTSSMITFSKLTAGNRQGAVPLFGYVLPFPKTVSVQTQFSWEPEALGIIGSAIYNTGSTESTGGMIRDVLAKIGSQAGPAIAANLANSIGEATGLGGAAGAGLARAKLALNPKEEVLFKGTKHREFDMTFEFAPMTSTDAAVMMAFLKDLHERAAPGLEGEGVFFTYPETVDIKVQDRGNIILNRGNCAITSIDVDLTPEQVWASFTDGKPVHVICKISFIELKLPTKGNKIFG